MRSICATIAPTGGTNLLITLCLIALQDAAKKLTGEELPDFYNIMLERPRDDEGGYDILFVDAASKVRVGQGAKGTRVERTGMWQWYRMGCQASLDLLTTISSPKSPLLSSYTRAPLPRG